MSYCFMKYRPASDGHGREPDCPDSVSCLLLAGPRDTEWGLWDYVDKESSGWRPEYPAGESLAILIESGKRYPPALAIARQETEEVCEGQASSKEDIQRAFASALQHHLSRQHEARYVLAMALQGDGIDLCKGEWYWVVSADSSTVSWVSDDFFVHSNPISAFDLTGAQLKYLG